MTYVQSSALEQVSYDPKSQTLCATFRDSGRTYIYDEVPEEVYDSLLFADSLGLPEVAGRVLVRRSADSLVISSDWSEHVELPLFVHEFHFSPRIASGL